MAEIPVDDDDIGGLDSVCVRAIKQMRKEAAEKQEKEREERKKDKTLTTPEGEPTGFRWGAR